MTSNMVAVPQQQTCQLGSSMLFFVSLYLRPLLTNEELSICSRTFVTSSITATIEVLVLVVFLVFASVLEVLQSISCLPCAPQTSLASRENFCASFFFGSTTGHCPSPYQIVAIQRLWRRWATFSQKRCPCIGFIFRCRTAAHRRRQVCLLDRQMHQASTLERGLVMVYLRSTLKKTHWLGHWTSRSQGGKKKQFDHISIDGVRHFFLRFQSDLRPGPPVMYRAACREAQRDFTQRRCARSQLHMNRVVLTESQGSCALVRIVRLQKFDRRDNMLFTVHLNQLIDENTPLEQSTIETCLQEAYKYQKVAKISCDIGSRFETSWLDCVTMMCEMTIAVIVVSASCHHLTRADSGWSRISWFSRVTLPWLRGGTSVAPWRHKCSHVPVFRRLFDRLPVRISISDLHHRILRKKNHVRAYDFGVQFSFKKWLSWHGLELFGTPHSHIVNVFLPSCLQLTVCLP